MTHKELMIEADMLTGNINRMMVTKDPKELRHMYEWAERRLQKIHKARFADLDETEVNRMSDPISRQAAIDMIERMKPYQLNGDDCMEIIANLPPAQPEIIRCKNCRYSEYDALYDDRYCHYGGKADIVPDEHYCGYAKRRTDELGNS